MSDPIDAAIEAGQSAAEALGGMWDGPYGEDHVEVAVRSAWGIAVQHGRDLAAQAIEDYGEPSLSLGQWRRVAAKLARGDS